MTPSILIVDDDLHFTQVLSRTLERHGHQTWVAQDGQTALALAKKEQPNWVSLDLRLDEESGLSLIRSIKKLSPNSRIVVLTGYASIPTAVEAIKLGADNYLHKPATVQELLAAFGEESCADEPAASTEESEVMSMERLEWEHIQRVLNEQKGNISATARILNMHRRTLQRKLQKYAPR